MAEIINALILSQESNWRYLVLCVGDVKSIV